MRILTFCSLLILALEGTTVAKSVNGTITLNIDLSDRPTNKPVCLWLPYPTTDQNQDITNVSISGNYATSAVYTDKTFGTPMLYAEWNVGAASRKLAFSFDAKREEIRPSDFPAKQSPWNPKDHALYLRPTEKAPFTDELNQLAAEITTGKEDVLAKARAIYDWTVENTWRDPETRGCGAGDMRLLIDDPCGKCADISSIFIALCRASGVPAREILGIRMGKEPVQDITTWQHCWAEFYLPGTGWITVDPADVRKKMLVEKLELTDPKTVVAREYFFGGADAYRIRLGMGREILPSPAPTAGRLNYLMYPYAEVGGQQLDWLDPKTFKYTITYTRGKDSHSSVAR